MRRDRAHYDVIVMYVFTLFAAACGLSCIITFGAGYPGVIKKLSPGLAALAVLLALDYSFALICLGALVALIAGVICVVDLVRGQ